MTTGSKPELRCVTWNIHRARGSDGIVDPDRIAQVLARDVCPMGSADVLALQEADTEVPPHAGLLDLARIEAETGLRHIHRSEALRWCAQSHGFLGAILFLHPDFAVTQAEVLDLPGHCHRGAVVAEVERGGLLFRIVTTHLSLGQPLRIVQMRIIGQYLRRRPKMQTILLGDLNEWRPWGGLALSPRVTGIAFQGPQSATFPARYPLLPLDRILTDRPGAVSALRAIQTKGVLEASDHLPLAAKVRLAG